MKNSRLWLRIYGKVIGAISPFIVLILLLNANGFLSTLELAIYDLFFQSRPLENLDKRIVIVGLEEPEIKEYYPLTDSNLAQLIKKINSQKPSVIGLDFYRDVSVGEGAEELKKVFESTSNLFGVQKVIGDKKSIVKPPAVLEARGLVASSDVVVDSDGVLRRGLLVPIADGKSNLFSLGATLGIIHLQSKGITPQTINRSITLGEVTFHPFRPHDGGYGHEDHGGYQVLLNFRNPQQSFQFVSFSEVLNNKVSPNLFTNRMVLIGATAPSIRDVFYTPFSRSLNSPPSTFYGVEIQANIASHLVSAVLDKRSIIRTLPNLIENLLMVFWGCITAILLWGLRSESNYLKLSVMLLSITLGLMGILIGGSYFLFLQGWWIPVISSFLTIGGCSLITIGLILVEKNQEIRQLLTNLEQAQEQIVQEKKQAGLAKFVAGVAHEINNPLTFINNFADLTLEASQKLQEEQAKYLEQLTPESQKKTQKLTKRIVENLVDLVEQSKKATRITQSLLRQAHPDMKQSTLTNINELVEANLSIISYSKQTEKSDFSLRVETEYDLAIGQQLVIAGDLNQIIVNLLNNACDAVFEKKDRVGSEFEPTILVTTNIIENQGIEIEVIDNGDGIPTEIVEHIFEPFNTSKEPGKGTGLGLFLVYDLVKQNQWDISWKRENELTKFSLRLQW